MDGAEDLTASLVELASLVAGGVALEETLRRIADYAGHAIRHADGVVLTLWHAGAPAVRVGSAPDVDAADAVQYEVDEGPCLAAVRERRSVRSHSLAGEAAWPRFGARVGRMGLHSVLAVPLAVHGEVIGSMAAYARAKAAFVDDDVRVAERYARPAAAIARNAHVIERSHIRVAQLTEALRVRPVIDQAIGIVRARTGRSEQEALDQLRRISSTERVPLSRVAERIVEEAVRRANARRRRGGNP